MALDAWNWRPRPVALTPLIDIIFLLLLFFMLSSTFTRFAEIPLVNAGGGADEDSPPLFVQLRTDEVALNGIAMPLDALLPAIADLAADEGGRIVLVTLSGEVTSQRLVDLLTILRGDPDLTVSVLE